MIERLERERILREFMAKSFVGYCVRRDAEVLQKAHRFRRFRRWHGCYFLTIGTAQAFWMPSRSRMILIANHKHDQCRAVLRGEEDIIEWAISGEPKCDAWLKLIGGSM